MSCISVGRKETSGIHRLALTMGSLFLMLPASAQTKAIRATDFLDSLGANSAICRRGETLEGTAKCVKYLGLRWLRSGTEGDPPIVDLIKLHQETGVRFSWGFLSGGSNLPKLIETGKQLAAAGAVLAFEGPNEPNNWGITYGGQTGGRNLSWLPVAKLQQDLYRNVKSEPLLKNLPVWGISEEGAETDNVGLQFLTVPRGAGAAVPDGTKFSDFANVHNYTYHPNSPAVEDNKTWDAADPTAACRVDGLFGEYGLTWAHHYKGYSESELVSLPRVTTETGCAIEGEITEEVHGLNLLSLYLDQFKRGWSYTSVYLLRDRIDEGGNQQFGFFKPDYLPRMAAIYLHNLTTILADSGHLVHLGAMSYSIPNQPSTVHELLLQKTSGQFDLLVWSERVKGTNEIQVNLGATYPRADLFDPTRGTSPTQSLSKVRSIPLHLTDHPVVIELRGARG